jgi:hypothetical protein
MAILKRTLPAVLAIAVGAVVLASLLLPVPQLAAAGRYLIDTAIVIAAFALFLGLINVVRVHVRHIRQRTATWPYSVLLLVVLATVLAIGLVYSPLRGEGGASAPAVRWIFTYVLAPMEATLGALLAFFILIAAYRLLRLRNVESAVLLVVTLLVLIGQSSTGLFPALSDLRNWILDVPVVAGVRGILLGVALGTILTGIRLLLGVERPYGD